MAGTSVAGAIERNTRMLLCIISRKKTMQILCLRCLKTLTPLKESLIAIVNSLLKVIQLPYRGVGYSGHVCSFPKHLDEICLKLRRLVADFAMICWVDQAAQTKDFRVRRRVILDALFYLVDNHPSYRGRVTIDAWNLQKLPRWWVLTVPDDQQVVVEIIPIIVANSGPQPMQLENEDNVVCLLKPRPATPSGYCCRR